MFSAKPERKRAVLIITGGSTGICWQVTVVLIDERLATWVCFLLPEFWEVRNSFRVWFLKLSCIGRRGCVAFLDLSFDQLHMSFVTWTLGLPQIDNCLKQTPHTVKAFKRLDDLRCGILVIGDHVVVHNSQICPLECEMISPVFDLVGSLTRAFLQASLICFASLMGLVMLLPHGLTLWSVLLARIALLATLFLFFNVLPHSDCILVIDGCCQRSRVQRLERMFAPNVFLKILQNREVFLTYSQIVGAFLVPIVTGSDILPNNGFLIATNLVFAGDIRAQLIFGGDLGPLGFDTRADVRKS